MEENPLFVHADIRNIPKNDRTILLQLALNTVLSLSDYRLHTLLTALFKILDIQESFHEITYLCNVRQCACLISKAESLNQHSVLFNETKTTTLHNRSISCRTSSFSCPDTTIR